jgi:hypothetical protein
MKILISVLFLILMLLPQAAKCDDLKVDIYYLDGEKSKDSHSSEELISIVGHSASYSIKYSGRRDIKQQDGEKECKFTSGDIEKVKKIIIEKELNVTDSLFEKDSKYKSFEIFCNINIDISMDGKNYKIRINGETKQFDDKELYKNSINFISFLKKMIEDC